MSRRESDATDQDQLVLSKQEAIELMTYLLASAECCTREPLYYGTFRLLDGASRLAGYVLDREAARDAWLSDFKAELDAKKGLLMWDRKGYYEFLQEAVGRIAERLPRQAPGTAGEG
jgi:Family of unknown function (DUF6092)